MRIDVYLASAGILSSRTEAKNMIALGAVYLDGRQVTRPSLEIDGLEDKITVDRSMKQYVSRGGIKLAGALSEFKVSPDGKRCIDVGASSGGFTDCLLQGGAKSVVAVDSGYGQLVKSLRDDPRVTAVENYNARYMKPSDFPHLFDLAVMDVSFISAKYIIEPLYACLSDGADYICLIKPQFEVGRAGLGKGGIVKDDKLRRDAVNGVVEFAMSVGFTCLGLVQSSIKGGDGNIEFLAHFKK